MTPRIDVDRLRADLARRAEAIVRTLLGEPTERDGKTALRYRRRGSFRIFITGAKAGKWRDYESGAYGDLIDLIKREHRCEFVPACEIAGELLANNYAEPIRKPVTEPDALTESEWRAGAIRLFREASRIVGTPGEQYLRKRGIELSETALPDLHGVLRFHGSCWFGPGREPCLVALFRNITTDQPAGILRIAITPELTKLGRPKSLGAINGAAIKLWPDAEITYGLVIGEGLETVLAATMIIHRGTLLRPAWATGGTGTMSTFPVLAGVDALTVLVDNDESGVGQDAADDCAARWMAAGREVIRLIPRKVGDDFNDIIKGSAA